MIDYSVKTFPSESKSNETDYLVTGFYEYLENDLKNEIEE